MKTSICFSCKGEYPDIQGAVHRYMKSTAGCWSSFGVILAKEYSDSSLMDVHRLSVDAYAVQHPGSSDRQSINSVGVHLVRLCLFFEYNLDAKHANDAILAAGKNKHKFGWLKPPSKLGELTAADVVTASSPDEHKSLVKAWAKSAWDAWYDHHAVIHSWLP